MSKKTKFFQNCLGVFQGGGCKGGAYIGAYKEAIERGVSFSELVGTSAGSVTAALIGAGATPDQLEDIMRNLDFTRFLTKPFKIANYTPPSNSGFLRFLPSRTLRDLSPVVRNLGKYNSIELQHWINGQLTNLIKRTDIDSIKFSDLIIPTNIVAANIVTKQVEIYGTRTTPNMSVAEAVQRSCNIPFFFQPIDMKYVDGGLLSNLPTFVFNESLDKLYSKILAFSVHGSYGENPKIETFEDYAKALIETTLDGNLDLQLKLQEDIYNIKINTGSLRATDFEKINSQVLDVLIRQGKEATSRFFDDEISLIRSRIRGKRLAFNSFQTNNLLVQTIDHRFQEILICDITTDWVYELFPTLLKWKSDGSVITVTLQENTDNKAHGEFRKRFLMGLGIQVNMIKTIPFRAFIFDGTDRDKCKALILNSNYKDGAFHSQMYAGEVDFDAINLLRNSLITFVNEENFLDIQLILKKGNDSNLLGLIKSVRQYDRDGVQCTMASIKVKDIVMLTRYVRGYKYRQIHVLFDLFSKFGIAHFKTVELILGGDKYTYFTPPVVEKIGNQYYLVEGNTRVTYAYKNGIDEISCVVVEGVTDPLPSTGRYRVNEILLTDLDKIGEDRFEGFEYEQFRHIERAVRPPDTCLLK